MSAIIRNPQKIALRRKIKELLKLVSKERVASQSASITRKVCDIIEQLRPIQSSLSDLSSHLVAFLLILEFRISICQIIASPVFQKAQRISIYLSLDTEVNTTALLLEMFRLNKQVRWILGESVQRWPLVKWTSLIQCVQVFVPSYSGNRMVMLKISGIDDYEALPLTKWNIRQPSPDDGRENSNDSGTISAYLDNNLLNQIIFLTFSFLQAGSTWFWCPAWPSRERAVAWGMEWVIMINVWRKCSMQIHSVWVQNWGVNWTRNWIQKRRFWWA